MGPSKTSPDLYVLSSGILPEERLLLASADALGVRAQHIVDTDVLVGSNGTLTQGVPVLLRTPSYFRSCVLASWLEQRGHRAVNSLEAVSRFGIKSRTDDWLQVHNLPSIPTCVCFGPHQLAAAAEQLGFPMVVKPDIGGFGTRVHLVRDETELRQISEYVFGLAPTHIKYLYLQKYLQVSHDLRVFVVDGAVAAVMDRVNDGGLAKNVAQGATGECYTLQPPERSVVEELCRVMPPGYFGVDLLVTSDGPVICEANATCKFSELIRVTKVDVAQAMVTSCLKGVA